MDPAGDRHLRFIPTEFSVLHEAAELRLFQVLSQEPLPTLRHDQGPFWGVLGNGRRDVLQAVVAQPEEGTAEQSGFVRGRELGAECCLHLLDNHAELLATQWLQHCRSLWVQEVSGVAFVLSPQTIIKCLCLCLQEQGKGGDCLLQQRKSGGCGHLRQDSEFAGL